MKLTFAFLHRKIESEGVSSVNVDESIQATPLALENVLTLAEGVVDALI